MRAHIQSGNFCEMQNRLKDVLLKDASLYLKKDPSFDRFIVECVAAHGEWCFDNPNCVSVHDEFEAVILNFAME